VPTDALAKAPFRHLLFVRSQQRVPIVRKAPLLVMSLVVPVFTVVPVLTVPGPTAHPVAPKISVTPLYGVDALALRELMTAEEPSTAPAAGVGALSVSPASFVAASFVTDLPNATTPPEATAPDPVVLTGKRAVAPFDLVGVTWAATDPARDAVVSVRVREDGSWTSWETLDLEDAGPDATSAEARRVTRAGTAPLLVHEADGLQVRVDRPSGRIPTDLRVNLIDAGQVPADGRLTPAAPARTALAATPYPNIILRSQWGADETLRSSPAEYNATVKVGVVHHTAGTNAYSASEAAGQVRAVYAFHTRGNGWSDIGYNFLVDKFGRIYEGRAGGMDLPVRGAHAGGYNVDTFGVSAIGNYDVARAPAVMTRAISRVLAWKLSLHNRDAYGTTALTSQGGGTSRLPAGETRDFPVIMGHRDVGQTTCPGRYLMARLPAIRKQVKDLVNASPWTDNPPVPPSPPPVDPALAAFVGPAGTNTGVLRHWLDLGGPSSTLGALTSTEFAVPGGAAQDFVGGRIYWSEQTGARSLSGEILRRYIEINGTASALGFPTSDQMNTVNGGLYNLMAGGKILYSPNSGAYPLWGDIGRLYDKAGAEAGTLGFPAEVEVATGAANVMRQRFGGGAVYWSPDRGARAVVGAIYARYLAEGAEGGSLGVPLTGEYVVPGGTRTDFAGGSLIWSAATGEIVLTR